MNLNDFINNLPKAELHVHIEGTMEPEQLLHFADRNKITVPYPSVEQAYDAYHAYTDLPSFINIYDHASEVLKTEQDFYELTLAYLKKAANQGVVHAEIFFDLQTYIPRHIKPGIIINGMYQAFVDAEKEWDISAYMIMCILRDLSEEDAFKAMQLLAPFKDKIIGIGLASVEEGNPPDKFRHVFAQARAQGYHVVAHAGEVCGPEMIWQAIDILQVERIDHGIACVKDLQLMHELVKRQMPITVCPLSNVALKIFKTIKEHPAKMMLEAKLNVSINSDDPAFFYGYIADNYQAVAQQLGFSKEDLITCARNSIQSSFLDIKRKNQCLKKLSDYVAMYN